MLERTRRVLEDSNLKSTKCCETSPKVLVVLLDVPVLDSDVVVVALVLLVDVVLPVPGRFLKPADPKPLGIYGPK